MKKRLLTAFLAAALIVTSLPASFTFAAQEDVKDMVVADENVPAEEVTINELDVITDEVVQQEENTCEEDINDESQIENDFVVSELATEYDYELTKGSVNSWECPKQEISKGQKVKLTVDDASAAAPEGVTVEYEWTGIYHDAEGEQHTLAKEDIEQDGRSIIVSPQYTTMYNCAIYYSSDEQQTRDYVSTLYFNVSIMSGLVAYIEGDTVNNNSLSKLFNVKCGADVVLTATIHADERVGYTANWKATNFLTGEQIIVDSKNPTYTVKNVQEPLDYTLSIFDSYGNSVILYYYIRIDTGLTLAVDGDANKNILPGENVTLRVNANTNDDTIVDNAYAWSVVDYNNPTTEYDNFDAEGNTCIVKDVNKKLKVTATVTDSYKNVKSVEMIISIETNLALEAVGDVTIKQVPGQPLALKVKATADSTTIGELSYAWYKMDAYAIYNKIDGALEDTYVDRKCLQFGDYKCIVEDVYGNTAEKVFHVQADDGFTYTVKGGLPIYVYAGLDTVLNFECSFKEGVAEEYKKLTYKWYVQNREEADDAYETFKDGFPPYYIEEGLVDNNEPSLEIKNITKTTKVKLTVENDYGLSIGLAGEWYLVPTTRLESGIQEDDGSYYGRDESEESLYYDRLVKIKAQKDETVDLTMKAICCPERELNFSWYALEGAQKELLQTKTVTVDTTGIAEHVQQITAENNKYYACEVEDPLSKEKIETAYYIDIDTGFVVDSYENNSFNKTVTALENETIKVYAPQVTIGDVYKESYEWSYYDENDEKVVVSNEPFFETTAKKTISYTCVITDGYGNYASRFFDIVIENGLEIIGEDTGEIVILNAGQTSANLTVNAKVNEGTLTYQWYCNNENVPEVKTNTYKVNKPGHYKVYVKDKYNNEACKTFFVIEEINKGYFAGASMDVSLKGYQKLCYTLIPENTAEYLFDRYIKSATTKNIHLDLYDENGKSIYKNPDDQEYFFDSGKKVTLEKDKAYTLCVNFGQDDAYDNKAEVSISVTGGTFKTVETPATPTPAPATQAPAPATQAPVVTTTPSMAPTATPEPKAVDNSKPVAAADGNMVTTKSNGQATISSVKKSTKKTITVPSAVTVNGVSYDVVAIGKNAFKNAAKATCVKFTIKKGQKLTVNKKAFKQSKVTKVQVKMDKKATTKEKNAVITAFTKAGIKKANIKITK